MAPQAVIFLRSKGTLIEFKRKATLKSLNKIWLDDHQAVVTSYPKQEEEDGMLKAAED